MGYSAWISCAEKSKPSDMKSNSRPVQLLNRLGDFGHNTHFWRTKVPSFNTRLTQNSKIRRDIKNATGLWCDMVMKYTKEGCHSCQWCQWNVALPDATCDRVVHPLSSSVTPCSIYGSAWNNTYLFNKQCNILRAQNIEVCVHKILKYITLFYLFIFCSPVLQQYIRPGEYFCNSRTRFWFTLTCPWSHTVGLWQRGG